MQTPITCRSLTDIRQAIDRIDHDIILKLAERMHYVLAASYFKPDAASIPAPERVRAMLPKRMQWAEEHQLDGTFVHDLFTQLIQWYITQQTLYWHQQHPPSQNDSAL
ncbi:isochorismate lyase [Zymobacter palmae]|uniref:chorismate mutase n=1 Tax=Zymobacter palmae TaxID=33074 RepID=A0A348HD66_9GAMM|nr:isochorismate lyase [Zymobacter palmae]BBG29568.1 chorismate mutase [Zymobacter palmae]